MRVIILPERCYEQSHKQPIAVQVTAINIFPSKTHLNIYFTKAASWLRRCFYCPHGVYDSKCSVGIFKDDKLKSGSHKKGNQRSERDCQNGENAHKQLLKAAEPKAEMLLEAVHTPDAWKQTVTNWMALAGGKTESSWMNRKSVRTDCLGFENLQRWTGTERPWAQIPSLKSGEKDSP